MKKLFTLLVLVTLLFSGVVEAKVAKKSPTPAPEKQLVTVLPEGFSVEPKRVVVYKSKDYSDLISQNKTLQQQAADEDKEFNAYKATTDTALRLRQEEAIKQQKALADAQAAAKKHHFWSFLFGGTSILLGIGGIGLLALGIFNPAIFVSVISIAFNVAKMAASIFGYVLGDLDEFIKYLEQWEAGRVAAAKATSQATPITPSPKTT